MEKIVHSFWSSKVLEYKIIKIVWKEKMFNKNSKRPFTHSSSLLLLEYVEYL